MTTTVTKLVTDAYYLSGRLARGLQIISGSQLHDGLRMLNAILAVKTVDDRLIPYFTKYVFDAEANIETYFIENLILAETLTFNYQNVRYSMTPMSRREYHGSSRVNNISSLMFNYNVERCKGGANLSMYFIPDSDYPLTIWGKFSLNSVVLNQDLELTLDNFYIEYLKYALAEYICHENNITFQPQNKQKLDEYEEQFLDVSAVDLTLVHMSGLKGKSPSIWGMANLSKGWIPY